MVNVCRLTKNSQSIKKVEKVRFLSPLLKKVLYYSTFWCPDHDASISVRCRSRMPTWPLLIEVVGIERNCTPFYFANTFPPYWKFVQINFIK